jgi:hypothetical protein
LVQLQPPCDCEVKDLSNVIVNVLWIERQQEGT